MRLTCDGVIVLLMKTGNPRIIPENGYDPILFFSYLQGRGFNAGFKEVINHLFMATGNIMVFEKPFEGVVVAVITAGLRDIFQFHISG